MIDAPVEGRLREDRKEGCEAVKSLYEKYWPEISVFPSAAYKPAVQTSKGHFGRAITMCQSFTGLVGHEEQLNYTEEMLEAIAALWGAGQPDEPGAMDTEEPVASTTTTTVAPEPQDIATLPVGSCFNKPDEEDLAEVVPCRQPHKFEKLADLDLWTEESRWDQYPGDPAIEREAVRRCDRAFESYVGVAYGSSRYGYQWWLTDSERWEDGDGRGFCAIDIQGETLTGSARGSRR